MIIQLARIICFVVAFKNISERDMEIIATDSNKVSQYYEWKLIFKNKFTITFTVQTLENSQKLWQRKVS